MPSCDMCGKGDAGTVALVEGVELTVCQNCARFGKAVRSLRTESPEERRFPVRAAKPAEDDSPETVVEDFASRIRQKREQLNLTQKEFAKMLNERESLVHHLENGSQRPSLELARKLEHALKIQLVEVAKEVPRQKSKGGSGPLTLGDFINIKKS